MSLSGKFPSVKAHRRIGDVKREACQNPGDKKACAACSSRALALAFHVPDRSFACNFTFYIFLICYTFLTCKFVSEIYTL